MNAKKLLSEYIRLTDVMYQSLKVHKYNIFEKALEDRGKLLKNIGDTENFFSSVEESEKELYRKRIIDIENKIESAMKEYKKHLDQDLSKVHASQAKLRKHSKVKNYYTKDYSSQGVFIDKSK